MRFLEEVNRSEVNTVTDWKMETFIDRRGKFAMTFTQNEIQMLPFAGLNVLDGIWVSTHHLL
jgi:hypothetical protein